MHDSKHDMYYVTVLYPTAKLSSEWLKMVCQKRRRLEVNKRYS